MVIPRAGLRRGRPSHRKDIMTFLNRYNTSPAYTDDNGPDEAGPRVSPFETARLILLPRAAPRAG
jgi:hypothetical protein